MKVIFPKIDLDLFSEVFVIDGGSTDGTIEWCEKNNIKVYHQKKSGLRNGFTEFVQNNNVDYDYILCFSPDGNCDPATLHKFINKLSSNQQFDLLIGSRYAENTKSEDDDIWTGFGNIFFTTLTNVMFHAKFTDVFSIYRAFKPSIISKLALDLDESYSWIEKLLKTSLPWEPLMTFRVAKYKLKYGEVGVGEPPRIGGERKLQVLRWGMAFLLQLIREMWYSPNNLR